MEGGLTLDGEPTMQQYTGMIESYSWNLIIDFNKQCHPNKLDK